MLVVAAIGVVLSLTLFSIARAWDRELQIARFHETAEERVETLRLTIGSGLEALQALGAFLASTPDMTREAFRSFAERTLARHPEIKAFSWNPQVPHSERRAVEQTARDEGFPVFGFTERNTSGALVPAAARDDYVVVSYIEPLVGNEAALGYDIASDPARRQTILAARDGGAAAITERITLVQETSDQFGALVLLPIYRPGTPVENLAQRRRHLQGFAVGVYRLSDMVERSLSTAPEGGATVYVFDRSAPPGKQRLFPRYAAAENAGDLEGPFLHTRSIDVAGRDWLIAVLPAQGWLPESAAWTPWAALTSGLLITLLLTAYLHSVLKQRARIESTVQTRTRELHAANAALRDNERALQRAHDELENRVEERTAQLRRSYEDLAREVAERQQAEEALRESEARFRDYAKSASDWLWEMDSQLRFTGVSDRYQALTGFSPEMTLGKTRWELEGVDPERSEAWSRHREDIDARRAFRDFSYARVDREGREHHFRISGVPLFGPEGEFLGYRGTGREVTAEVEAERARRFSEARFRDVVENSPAAVSLKDLEGRYRLTNRRFEEWYGLASNEIIGRTPYDLFPPELVEDLVGQDRKTLQSGKATTQEIALPRPGGAFCSTIITKFPVLGADGEAIGVGTISTDVTELRQAEAQLRQAQKMEAVGQLTGGVAHDFNNLLAVVLGNLELIEERLRPDDELHGMVRKAIDAADRGAALVERLLAFSRAQALQPEAVDVEALISGLLDLLRRSLGETIVVTQATGANQRLCRADPRQLENALLNLAINARDAMPDGGTLRLESSSLHLADVEAAAPYGLQPGDYVCLAVSDSGCGMTEDVIEHVFDPFFTTKEVGKGSGLGLSMVYGFARQSGGQAQIESAPGRGTTVRLYLPCAPDEATRKAHSPTATVLAGSGEKVLVVEDDADLRSLVVSMLQGLGYGVEECSTGPAALRRLEESGAAELLLTDVKLPGGLSGPQLAATATKRWPHMPVLYMSGYADERPVGDFPLLPKPFRRAELAKAVRTAIDG